jgi:L-amino acid N-acyltransferase YncA
VTVRQATPADEAQIRTLYHRVSARSLYLRYFSSAVDADRAVDDLMRRADDGEVAVALLDGEVVGVASYVRLADPRKAEISLIVEDAHQHMGIGHLMLDHLIAHARARGVVRFVAEILTENVPMLHLAAHCGLAETAVMEGPVVDVALALTATRPSTAQPPA